jgi:WD40 repeat protein
VCFASSGREGGARFHLDEGILKVEAENLSTGQRLIFATDHVRFGVLGTRFRLYGSEGASRIELEEGKVEVVRLADRQTIVLEEGWSVVARADAKPNALKPQPLPMARSRLRHSLLKAGTDVQFSPDGRLLATAGRLKGLKVWDVSSGSLRGSVPAKVGRSYGPAFSSDGAKLVSFGSSGTVSIWPIEADKASCSALEAIELGSGDVSPDGRWLAAGRPKKREIAVWSVNCDDETIALHKVFRVSRNVWGVAVAAGHPLLAYSLWGGPVVVREVESERVVYQTDLGHTVSRVALSGDGRYLAAYNKDGVVVADLQTKTVREIWVRDCPSVVFLDFAASENLLLAGLEDGTARAWTVADGRQVMIIDTGDLKVESVAISLDRSLVATEVTGDQVKIWEYDLAGPRDQTDDHRQSTEVPTF